MSLFEKKVTIFKKKDAETWKKIRKVLKEEGVSHVHAGHYANDVVSENGISGMVDPRDFGVGHHIDRDIYFIEVRKSDEEKAEQIIRRHGLVTGIDEMASVDAADRPEVSEKINQV